MENEERRTESEWDVRSEKVTGAGAGTAWREVCMTSKNSPTAARGSGFQFIFSLSGKLRRLADVSQILFYFERSFRSAQRGGSCWLSFLNPTNRFIVHQIKKSDAIASCAVSSSVLK